MPYGGEVVEATSRSFRGCVDKLSKPRRQNVQALGKQNVQALGKQNVQALGKQIVEVLRKQNVEALSAKYSSLVDKMFKLLDKK